MRPILFLYIVSHSLLCITALPCNYFDPKIDPSTCEASFTASKVNGSEYRSQMDILKSHISSLQSIVSFQMLYKDDLIASVSTLPSLNSTLTLTQPFLLAVSSLIFSDSSHSSYTPFPKVLRRLAPSLSLQDVSMDSYLSDILSLQVYDHLNDKLWYGPNISVSMSRKAFPAVERIMEAYLGENMRNLVQKIRSIFGLESFRLDQTNGGSKVIRSTTKDLLRMGNIISSMMGSEFSNFSRQYSHFPFHSQDLERSYKAFKYGWWVNGAAFHGDKSNLIQLAPGDMIGSLECTTNLYIAPSWNMILVIQRSVKSCTSELDWLEEDKKIWELISDTSLSNEIVSRHSLGFVTTGIRVIYNFMFFFLYCLIGHVVTTYVVKLMWNVSSMLSDKTKFKHS